MTTTAAAEQAAKAIDPDQPRSGKVVIQPGNNLWKLSRIIYGRGINFTVIYQANKEQIRNPNRIYPGQIFAIPDAAPPEVDRSQAQGASDQRRGRRRRNDARTLTPHRAALGRGDGSLWLTLKDIMPLSVARGPHRPQDSRRRRHHGPCPRQGGHGPHAICLQIRRRCVDLEGRQCRRSSSCPSS